MSYQFENSDSYARSSEFDNDANAARSALVDDAFKVAPKAEVAPVLVATNDRDCSSNDHGCGTTEPHDDDDHETPQPVETPKPQPEINNNIDNNNSQNQDQAMEQKQAQDQAQKQNQGQGQEQSAAAAAAAEAKAQQALDNRNDIYNQNGDNKQDTKVQTGDTKQDTKVQTGDTTVGNAIVSKNQANNGGVSVNTGGNKYFSNARGESLPGNECQLFAGRADGHFMGTGGGLGLSVSDEACIQAKAEKVKCDAPASLGVANEHNTKAEQMWLSVANSQQKEEIIKHGMANTAKISDAAAQKAEDCVAGVDAEKEEVVVKEKIVVQQQQGSSDTSGFATKKDLQQLNQEFGSKLDVVHKYNMRK